MALYGPRFLQKMEGPVLLNKIFDKVTLFLSRLSSILLWMIVLTVAFNIVSRKLFNFTIAGMIEIVQYGMLTVMVLSMARTTFSGGHVNVSIITGKLPKAARNIVGFITLLGSAALVFAAAYVCSGNITKTIASGLTTERYKIPMYLIYSIMCFGLVTSGITFVYNAFSTLVSTWKKEPAKAEEGGAEG